MPNSGPATQIREALLTSPYIEEVLVTKVAGSAEEIAVVGVRVSIANVPDLASLPPVIAELRALVRGVVGTDVAVFVEPDTTAPERKNVSTESIVIRSWD
ncbi:hypothetical protein [Gulosibacter chungangensis]|uniref:DUF59 domain-containing protein n=1 Tax=Gulosibacter chungangensis TaxID=979746 RepID=A0A7J5BFG6_9MICO|nr:hypothetical protein [Gulosibacter chungangensis]KAB1644985.1 hypothetical protein F8O05_01615 [Gulosibacter chungangensis]